MQTVTTVAPTAGLSGTFTLSFGEFENMGTFNRRACDDALVTVSAGDSALTWDSGTTYGGFDECIARGDYIRINGVTFRVSTDSGATFSPTSLPLATIADPSVGATYTGETLSVGTPAYMLDTSLGACSVSVGDSDIQTKFQKQDLTEVDNDVLSAPQLSRGDVIRIGDLLTGETYRIHSTDSWTSSLLPLADLSDPSVGATFDGSDVSFRPCYKLQTTTDIAYDADEATMKSALEDLGLIGNVDVSRYVKDNGYTWKITFRSLQDGSSAKLTTNDFLNLAAPDGASIRIATIGQYDISDLRPGSAYYTRVSAYNGVGVNAGYGIARSGAPLVATPTLLTPGQVQLASLQVVSNSDLFVQWEAPAENGGIAVTKYEVEWDLIPSFTSNAGSALGSATVDATSVGALVDVQRIQTENTGSIGGTFIVEFDGQLTDSLPYDVSALDMQAALNGLVTIGKVTVSRNILLASGGHSWSVTFSDMPYPGTQESKLIVHGEGLSDGNVYIESTTACASLQCESQVGKGRTRTLSLVSRNIYITFASSPTMLLDTANS